MRGLIATLLLCVPLSMWAQEYPARPDKLVNDYVGVLSAAEARDLEAALVAYDRETSVQISIAIVKTLDGYPISDYTYNLYEKWGVGASGKDNGALLLVSMEERKMWITTGYGLEGALPDVTVKHIIEGEIKPYFKQKRYAEGLRAGSDAIIAASRGEYAGQGGGDEQLSPGKVIGIVAIVLFIIILSLMIQAGKAMRHARLNNVSFWVAWALLNAASRRHTGSWGDFHSGRGGFGGWGGGGGGGGFGGFGGGHSGGGGAGGSW
jgi:uncharacterized protein